MSFCSCTIPPPEALGATQRYFELLGEALRATQRSSQMLVFLFSFSFNYFSEALRATQRVRFLFLQVTAAYHLLLPVFKCQISTNHETHRTHKYQMHVFTQFDWTTVGMI